MKCERSQSECIMNYNENESKVDMNFSLNQKIDRFEISLNSITEELETLKKKKQALDKTISRCLETKDIVVIENDNSTESPSKKKKKSEKKSIENGHVTVEIQEPCAINNYNFIEMKNMSSKTISISEVSMDEETLKLKKKKRKNKNKANEDLNIESSSIYEYETPSKKKKKDRNISTNLDTPPAHENIAESTDIRLEDKEIRKPKHQKNQKNENEAKVDTNSSLNQNINRLETSLNSLMEELQKLKENKQALENIKNKTSDSISKYLETNNKRKEIVIVEYENSAKSENKHETIENYYLKEVKDKKSRTISEQISMEDVETITSKKRKRKKKNKLNKQVNIGNPDVNESTSIYEDETPRKIKKKERNIVTNLDTSSTNKNIAQCTEILLEDKETRKPKLQKVNENANSSLNQTIERLETSLNSLTENLRKLKEKKQALENCKINALNSICGNLESNSNKKEIVVEYNNSAESISKEKELIENGHEIVENNDNYIKERKDKRSRTISLSEDVSMENVETITPKKMKRTKKNKANVSISTCEDEIPKKKSKKDINVSTNLETPSAHENTVVCTENVLVNEEPIKSKQRKKEESISNKITEIEKMDLKSRLEIIKKLVNSFAEEIDQQNENTTHSEHPLNTTVENIQNNPREIHSSQNFQSNDIPYNNKLNYNNFSDQNNGFEYISQNNNNPVQNGRFLNNSYRKQYYWRKEKIQLRDELKLNVLQLDFNGSNISDLPGYGERVHKF